MVGKLMKHELRAIFRVLGWFMLAVALLSVLSRISLELMTRRFIAVDNTAAMSASLSSVAVVVFWFLSLVALSCAGVILCLVRYFKSLFTGEGYMTFSLPVTPTQLLISKFLLAFVVSAACYAEIILSVLLALPAETALSAMESLFYSVFPQIFTFFAAEPLYGLEIVLLLIVSIPTGLVFLFLIASVGQLFTKGRVAITIALYYGASFAINLLLSLFLVPLIQMGMISAHLILWTLILGIAAFDVGGFFIIRYILSRKVNLVV